MASDSELKLRKHHRSSSPDDTDEHSKRRKHRHHHHHYRRRSRKVKEEVRTDEMEVAGIHKIEVEEGKYGNNGDESGAVSDVMVSNGLEFAGVDYDMEEGDIVEEHGFVDNGNGDLEKSKNNLDSDIESGEVKNDHHNNSNLMTGGRGEKLPIFRADKGKQSMTYRRRVSSAVQPTRLFGEDSPGMPSPPLSVPAHLFGDSYVHPSPYNLTPLPEDPSPIVDPPIHQGDSSTQAPSEDQSPPVGSGGTDWSTAAAGGRLQIQPRGREFTNQSFVARRIGRIIESKFTGAWKSYKKVPIDIRDFWFSEFAVHFTWGETQGREVRRIFDHIASNALKNSLYDAKSTNTKPQWISPTVWAALLLEWSSEPHKNICAKNKQNRASDCGGKGFPSHFGGSISHVAHADKLRATLGRELTIAETFMQTHSRLNSEGERVWSDARSQTHHDNYVDRYEQRSSEGETSTPVPPLDVQMDRWTEMVGGEYRGRVYDLAGMASQRNVTAQVLGRSEREVQLESSLQSMEAKLAGLQGEFDAMKSQLSLMMSMMQQRPQDIGTTLFDPPSTGTPYPTHIATPREGGSHSRRQLPPYDQFAQGDGNDSEEDDG